MNKPKNTTKPKVKASPAAIEPHLTCSVDTAALRKMSMKELHDFREVLHTVADILCALAGQRRFEGDTSHTSNIAGETLAGISTWCCFYEDAAAKVARDAKPVTTDDVEYRGWAILNYNAALTDSLADFAVLASEAARDEARAQFRESHPVRGAA